jgi:integral membrane protein
MRIATPLDRLRLIGLLEGSSFLALLFIAMPLKYLADQTIAVRYLGLVHGILFLLYLFALIPVALERRWSWRTCGLGFLASLVPFGPFIFDAKILKLSDGPSR